MKAQAFGRFTACGSSALEARATALAHQIGAAARRAVPPDALAALVLLGGYGRGEGGVEQRAGAEHLHNNLDLLLITAHSDRTEALRRSMEDALDPLRAEHQIGIDLGVISAAALARCPPLVMWCDMRAGHKTLAGDARLVPALTHLTLDRILPWDVETLLVNRASLLALNEAMRAGGAPDERAARKHLAKAIIGYGDAALFFVGRYDASYLEKARRVQQRRELPVRFRQLHAWASEFRLRPDYAAASGFATAAVTEELLDLAPGLHLRCTARRLGTHTLGWPDFAERVLGHGLVEGLSSPRLVARKLRDALRAQPTSGSLSRAARLGLRTGGERALFSVTLPAVLYPLGPEGAAYRRLAAELLSAPSDERGALLRAYLRRWTRAADPNAPRVLEKLGLSLQENAA